MKGSISEFELGVLRTRMLEAARSKARRGELRRVRIVESGPNSLAGELVAG